MSFREFCKSKAGVLLLNAGALLLLSVYLFMLKNTGTAVFIIIIFWILALCVYLLGEYFFRRKYFRELLSVLEELDQRYLIAEVMKPGPRLEDRLYWEILKRSNKSVMEKIHEVEDSQKEYKEYVEAWIHEVKTPIAAARLICENRRDEGFRRVLTELDEIENEVEKILYFARMERVYQDYLIYPVNLRKVVLSAIQGEKRHFIQCGMEISLDMEDLIVSTDEKWVEFILKQIFSNSMKYKKDTEARMKIYVEKGENRKSLILEDNGLGIRAEDLSRIFDKGFTGENGRLKNSHATGMGLYLCQKLCEKLEIGISCQSEPGTGTRMILTFPDSDHNKLYPY